MIDRILEGPMKSSKDKNNSKLQNKLEEIQKRLTGSASASGNAVDIDKQY